MDQGFILLNGDNLLHPNILKPLLDAGGDCCLLAQRKGSFGTDDMKVQVTGNRVTRIGKSLSPNQTDAESVGIIHFSAAGALHMRRALEEVLTQRAAMGRFFVDAIQHLIDLGLAVTWADTGGLPWIDVDTPEDLEFAQKNFLRLFAANSALSAAVEDRA
jgi:choline kinase